MTTRSLRNWISQISTEKKTLKLIGNSYTFFQQKKRSKSKEKMHLHRRVRGDKEEELDRLHTGSTALTACRRLPGTEFVGVVCHTRSKCVAPPPPPPMEADDDVEVPERGQGAGSPLLDKDQSPSHTRTRTRYASPLSVFIDGRPRLSFGTNF
jgi:hypothetical protein